VARCPPVGDSYNKRVSIFILFAKGVDMKAQDVIQNQLSSTQQVLSMLVGDLSDADVLVRPVPGANTVALQMGHLIVSEQMLCKENIPGAQYSELPAGFVEQHALEKAAADPSTGFRTKAEYVDLFNKTRQATIAAAAKLSEADLDRPSTGKMAKYAPTAGHILGLLANHTLMHAGQFSVLRRKLGKPHVM
jgi:hypothetical protein